jgi:gas vesicle protein
MMGMETGSRPDEWLMGIVRRNPEGLLVVAAGLALLMRGGKARTWSGASGSYGKEAYSPGRYRAGDQAERWSEGAARSVEGMKGYASDMKDRVADVKADVKDRVADVKDRVADTAGNYASQASRYAQQAQQSLVEQTSRFGTRAQETFGAVLRTQPLAVAALGLAAGAVLAALFPPTRMERQALGPARDAIADAAQRAGETIRQAAGEAGEHLKQRAAERGLSREGLAELGREAAEKFSRNVSGQAAEEAPSVAPDAMEPMGRGDR